MGNVKDMETEFLVTPKEFSHSVQMMDKAAEKAKKELEQLSLLFHKADTCFCGRAAECFLGQAGRLTANWQELLLGLHNSTADLQKIAQNYECAEGDNINVIMENVG